MYKIVQYCNSVHEHKPKFGLFLSLPVLNYFSCPFPFLFLGHFTLATGIFSLAAVVVGC